MYVRTTAGTIVPSSEPRRNAGLFFWLSVTKVALYVPLRRGFEIPPSRPPSGERVLWRVGGVSASIRRICPIKGKAAGCIRCEIRRQRHIRDLILDSLRVAPRNDNEQQRNKRGYFVAFATYRNNSPPFSGRTPRRSVQKLRFFLRLCAQSHYAGTGNKT